MLNYAICEIGGKQYKFIPGQPIEVDFQGEEIAKNLDVPVLLLSDGDKIELGKPYLKKKLSLKILENTKAKKIRVSKFHAKANFRKTVGNRSKLTKMVLDLGKVA